MGKRYQNGVGRLRIFTEFGVGIPRLAQKAGERSVCPQVSLIPVIGSGWQAIHDFQTGHWGWGIVNTGLAISDVFLVKSLVTAAGKVGVRGLIKLAGSNTWSASKKWMIKNGWREFAGQEFHHWLIPQGSWGRMVPGVIKNQPWNIMRMGAGTEGRAMHVMIHGGRVGDQTLSTAGRLWFGSPTWSKVLLSNSLMRGGTYYEPEANH